MACSFSCANVLIIVSRIFGVSLILCVCAAVCSIPNFWWSVSGVCRACLCAWVNVVVVLMLYSLQILVIYSFFIIQRHALFENKGTSMTTAGFVGLYFEPIVVAFTTTVVSLDVVMPCFSCTCPCMTRRGFESRTNFLTVGTEYGGPCKRTISALFARSASNTDGSFRSFEA